MRAIGLAAALGAVLASIAPTTHAAPCAGFTDVQDTSAFCVNVAWMKNRGITLGCTATLYCPADPVTRLQMAAFLYRLGFQNAFLNGGNAFGATATLGSTDAHAVDTIVNGQRVMSYRPTPTSPTIVGGHANNIALPTFHGQAVGGGGRAGTDCYDSGTFASDRTCGNAALEDFATIGGGLSKVASGEASTVPGGEGNTAAGHWSVVGGGQYNRATELWATVVGGVRNLAAGQWSTVLGGIGNRALGYQSVVAGHDSIADLPGCVVVGAWSTLSDFGCLGLPNVVRFGADHGWSIDYFARRSDGGGTRWLYVGDDFAGRTLSTWSGAHLTDAGVWVDASSSRAAKTDFAAVDADDVLAKVAALPITTWRYRDGEGAVRHIGPMAEDFHAAFAVGYGPHTIADLDARGVALAAIGALHRKVEAKDAELEKQRATIDALVLRLRTIEERMARFLR